MYLNCHTYYSLRYGTMSPLDLAQGSFAMNADTVALTDINNTSAIPEFYFACRKSGVKPVAGVDIRDKNNRCHYVLIAKNNEGLYEINRFISICNQEFSDYHTNIPLFRNVYVIIPYENYSGKKLMENEFVGIRPKQVKSLLGFKSSDVYKKSVILHSVSFINSNCYDLHKILVSVKRNTLITKLPQNIYSSSGDSFISPAVLRECFSSLPQTVANTMSILKSSSLYFDQSHKNLKRFTGDLRRDIILLRRNTLKGMRKRYGDNNVIAFERVKHELQIIEKLGFVSYFLITWDIIRYSKNRGFFHVGRGSGANSIVAYCLGITDVDPIELNLYFERFLNPKRSSPPDFDIDYSWKDRDEVLNYIFKKYGNEHTALLGAMSTFKTRAALRELAKVYGLPATEIEELTSYPHRFKNRDSVYNNILTAASKISGFPNLRTIHAGGVLISDDPIYYYTATDMPPKGMPVSQWDMYVAEDLGFEKFDILSQRGLGHIRECVEIIKQNKNTNIDITKVEDFKKDENVKKLLSKGETVGCFYIESPAMRGLIKKLKCNDYKTLVAASSIIRPGVSQSGMMKEYIKRYNNPNSFKYLHPVLKEELNETYGIMVYQEDVLKICNKYAGLDLADADMIRRAMSGKFRSKTEFLKIRDKFFDACNSMKRPINISAELWRQIESFAGYSFSKAHSASYAVESYQSLYLKAYFPLEFITAVINNFGGFYNSATYFQEAKRMGAIIQKPCVNNSLFLNRLKNKTIYMGFVHVKSLERRFVEQIITERDKNGKYSCFDDFCHRVLPCEEQLNILVRAGAFSFTNISEPELLWKACLKKSKAKKTLYQTQTKLFYIKEPDFELPDLNFSSTENAYNEIELFGFPVSVSFFDLLKTRFRGEVMSENMCNFKNKTVRMLGMFVCIKYVRVSGGDYMNFCTWLDFNGNYFDSVHFPDSLKKYPFRGFGVYLMLGKIDVEFDYPVLRVEKFAKMELMAM